MAFLRCVPVGFNPTLDEYALVNRGVRQKCVKCHAEVWVHPKMAPRGLTPVCKPCCDAYADEFTVILTEEAIRVGEEVAKGMEELERQKEAEE